jgi:cell division protein FtsW (lipid II flippase)
MSTKTSWIVMIISAILSFISFIQIDSAFADKNHFNLGFIVIGVVLGLVAIGCLVKVAKSWGS